MKEQFLRLKVFLHSGPPVIFKRIRPAGIEIVTSTVEKPLRECEILGHDTGILGQKS